MRDRRSFLNLIGGVLTAIAVMIGAFTVFQDDQDGTEDEPNDDEIGPPAEPSDDAEVIDIDYDQYDQPSDVYRVWTGKEEESYSFVGDRGYNGTTGLRCDIQEGENNGSNATYWFPKNGYDQPTEVYQRSVIALDDDWQMEDDDVCRIWFGGLNDEAGPAGSSGEGPPTGDDGWSNLAAVTTRGTDEKNEYNLAVYTYHMDQPNSAGELEVVDASVRSGEWFELESHVRLNSIDDGEAVPNGEVRYWLNGELVYERTDFRWTTTDEQGIEHVGPVVRYGGSEDAPVDLSLYYDEHRIVLGDVPPIPPYDERDDFVRPERMDDYGGRLTFASGDERTEYTFFCDGTVVQTEWSNVDGHRATYNDTVSIVDDDYTVVEATIVPSTADGYLYDGDIVAISADPDPSELWIDGTEVDIDEYPDRPDE